MGAGDRGGGWDDRTNPGERAKAGERGRKGASAADCWSLPHRCTLLYSRGGSPLMPQRDPEGHLCIFPSPRAITRRVQHLRGGQNRIGARTNRPRRTRADRGYLQGADRRSPGRARPWAWAAPPQGDALPCVFSVSRCPMCARRLSEVIGEYGDTEAVTQSSPGGRCVVVRTLTSIIPARVHAPEYIAFEAVLC